MVKLAMLWNVGLRVLMIKIYGRWVLRGQDQLRKIPTTVVVERKEPGFVSRRRWLDLAMLGGLDVGFVSGFMQVQFFEHAFVYSQWQLFCVTRIV